MAPGIPGFATEVSMNSWLTWGYWYMFLLLKELSPPDGLPARTHPLGRGVFNETPSHTRHHLRYKKKLQTQRFPDLFHFKSFVDIFLFFVDILIFLRSHFGSNFYGLSVNLRTVGNPDDTPHIHLTIILSVPSKLWRFSAFITLQLTYSIVSLSDFCRKGHLMVMMMVSFSLLHP